MEKAETDKILRETFKERPAEESGSKASASQLPAPETQNPSPLALLPIQIETPPSLAILPAAHAIDFKYELASSAQKPSFKLPSLEPINLFEHLPKDLIILGNSLVNTPQLHPSLLPKNPALIAVSPPPPARNTSIQITHSTPHLPSSLPDSLPSTPMLAPQIISQLPDFPSLNDLETSSYSDFFDTEIVLYPLEDKEGYLFAITLVPKPGFTLPKMRHHYSFLIDRSNSIQKERLSAVKNAVLKAIEELDLEDSFNIIAFDSKIDKLSPAPLPGTKSSIHKAKQFLEQVRLGSFFSTSNLTKPLLLTTPSSAQDEGLHTAILFTDGEPLGKKISQRELVLDWSAYNQGRVSLFVIGLGGDPHLSTLDAAAAFNRGKLIYPPSKRGIKRKLLKLIKTIGHPVAKNITATAISRASQTKIALYPKTSQRPSLYLNEPYVILGTIDKLDNFILFVQGRVKGQWLNIKKNISFANAKKGDASLRAEWAMQQAYGLYEKYLYDFNPNHLAEAQTLLEPHDLQVAFQ